MGDVEFFGYVSRIISVGCSLEVAMKRDTQFLEETYNHDHLNEELIYIDQIDQNKKMQIIIHSP